MAPQAPRAGCPREQWARVPAPTGEITWASVWWGPPTSRGAEVCLAGLPGRFPGSRAQAGFLADFLKGRLQE